MNTLDAYALKVNMVSAKYNNRLEINSKSTISAFFNADVDTLCLIKFRKIYIPIYF